MSRGWPSASPSFGLTPGPPLGVSGNFRSSVRPPSPHTANCAEYEPRFQNLDLSKLAGLLRIQADWAAYVAAQGGPGVRRRDQRVRVAKVWSDELGRYGEPRGDTVIGVSSEDVTVQTRVHTWRIELSIDAQGAPRLSTGKSDVVRDSGRTPAGRSPAGVGPLSPRPTGVPVSSAGCLAHD